MAEYIEREATCKDCLHYGVCIFHLNGNENKQCKQFLNAADVEPVVHGKWIGLEYDGYANGCPVYDLWECSECGEEVSGEDVPDTHPWCHGCGARMDGE